jgi:hypothetical protein
MKKMKGTSIKTTVRMPASLWAGARIRAIKDGMTAQEVVVAALEAYLRGGRR